MKSRQLIMTGVSLTVLSLTLFNFQNCAPAGKSALASGSSSSVHVIEDLNKAQLQFVSPSVQIQDSAIATTLEGFCASGHDGAQLQFTVADPNQATQPILSGSSSCKMGQFSLSVQQLSQLNCGVSYYVVVEGDWGASAYAYVTKMCAPEASEPLAAPDGSPYGTACQLDYSNNSCTQNCYRDEKLVSQINVDVSQCSAMANQMASQ